MLALALAAAVMPVGTSARGVPIEAVRQGPADAPKRVLVVGVMHGDERAGLAVVRALRRIGAPDGVQLWTVRSANPDGERLGTRQNARGVDLNRNFDHRWRAGGRPGDLHYPGASAASEPETRALQRLIARIQPDVTIWYHQHLRMVVRTRGADQRLIGAYARRVGLPAGRLPHYRGTATSWQNARHPASTAFVVELAAGWPTGAVARRHARAVLATVKPRRGARAAPATATVNAPRRARAVPATAKPTVVRSPIPFGATRRRQTRAYAERHYGVATDRLTPMTIVEHYSASNDYASVYNTFASNAPDVELHELPGVCTHFVIDRDGTIHQLVRLRLICRHTIGLNDVAIGIEHVGTSDAAVMGNHRQLRASLRLTRWLQGRYGIATRYVIGHAESLSSPFHHERVSALRTRTHGDMGPATMRRYRRRLDGAR